jgi:hypothetical protein
MGMVNGVRHNKIIIVPDPISLLTPFLSHPFYPPKNKCAVHPKKGGVHTITRMLRIFI